MEKPRSRFVQFLKNPKLRNKNGCKESQSEGDEPEILSVAKIDCMQVNIVYIYDLISTSRSIIIRYSVFYFDQKYSSNVSS